MHRNVFTTFLKGLKIKHTLSYSNRIYEEHPNKYNLYGISQMLYSYNIPNMGIHVTDKNIYSLNSPFIAHVGNDFVVVNNVEDDNVNYYWNNRDISISEKQFRNLWTGFVLIAEPTKDSMEPNYRIHFKDECISKLQTLLIVGIASILLILSCISQSISLVNIIMLVFSIGGGVISYLLLQKQIYRHSLYADKICSLFKKQDCNNVLESDASKLFGWISWSEIGFGYFITNIILITLLPDLFKYQFIFNICALPYTCWSVWYQYKIEQWCTLCLIVQVLLWCTFFTTILTGQIYFFDLQIVDILIVIMLYAFTTLAINTLATMASKNHKSIYTQQELNSLKSESEVFLALLKKQPYYKVDGVDSRIIFGNAQASLKISILTNPHCSPCARMHKRVEELLERVGDRLSVQYLFSAFNEELLNSNQFLIALYINKGEDKARVVYKDWYENGKAVLDKYMKQSSLSLNDEAVMLELQRHNQWKQTNSLSATPTILVNGYLLPNKYKIEDLVDFCELEIS